LLSKALLLLLVIIAGRLNLIDDLDLDIFCQGHDPE